VHFVASGRLEVRITPADVGKRVSVRMRARPEDHPARFTDTVGVLSAWEGGVLSVTRRDGRVARLPASEMVAAKVVPEAPPRPRGTPSAGLDELRRVAARSWPAPESETIGGWTARAASGWSHRANSAYRSGEGEADLERIAAWYAARGLPPALQVTTGAPGGDEALAAELERRGWRAAYPTVVQVAALAPLADREADARVSVGRELGEEWLRGSPAARRDPAAARRVLLGGPSVWFATVAGGQAVGRCVVDGRWAGFGAIHVAPEHRRRGLATAVMAELARAALAEGASAAHLQVEADNAPALTLYQRLGFADHHGYHYREPDGG
jgi:ribosomal protein S18 acetylase RimI-like enzyme